ncbi:MAG: NYN domain-containing protein, partial [Mycobacterium sp.]
MSLIEDVTTPPPQPIPPGPAMLSTDNLPGFATPVGRVLLVWDAPNLDMGLGSI